MGYATYLTFIFGYVSTLVTVYYLAIKSVPALLEIFPRFIPFAVLATIIGGPFSIAVGWMHYKRIGAYSSEVDIQTESNPYNYKLAPGYNREVYGPLYLELLMQLKRLLESQNLLGSEESERIDALEKKLKVLIDGGMVGKPRGRL